MSDHSTLLIILGAIIPLYYLLKPLFSKSPIPHAAGGHWIAGHTLALHEDPVAFMETCREKYGPLFSVNHFGRKMIVFGKEWIDEVFKNKNLDFDEAINDAFFMSEIIGSQICMHEPKMNNAKVVRSMITPFLKSYNTKIYDQVSLTEKELLSGQQSAKFDSPAEVMRRMIVKASCSIMLGDRLSEDEEIIEAFYNYPLKVEFSVFSIIKYNIIPIIGKPLSKYFIQKEQVSTPYKIFFYNKISKEANIRKQEESNEDYVKPNDLLQRLLDEDYTLEEVTILMLALIFASIMTTTNTSTLALYDMATYPQFCDELYQEQIDVEKVHGNQLNPEILSEMPKLNSFIRESMRFRVSGISNFRYTTADWVLSNGITIPKGTMVGVDNFSLHYDDDLQGGNAYEFQAFRHVEKGKIATKVEPQNVSFGLGQHACPGRFLAIQEIMTILAIVIRNYKISTEDGNPHPYQVRPKPFDLPKGEPLIFTKLEA